MTMRHSGGAAARADDPVTQYARDVLDGKVVAGRLVRLACERHLRDLETGEERGLFFDAQAACHAIEFFRFLRHSKGEWAGAVIELEPWQMFRIGSVFGWMRENPDTGEVVRRFRIAYNEVARKNGKSTESAGIGLYMLDADGEPGAEVYSAATKRDQARIVWDEAARMVQRSPALRKRINVLRGRGNMHVLDTHSKFEPLGADVDGMDGLNVHAAIIDELHAHRTREVWDVLDTATGARKQPLIWAITTAGFDQTGICYEVRTYAAEVLEGRIEDDTFFAYIATIDEEDDPFDEAVWIKANPNLGVSVKLDDMRRLAKRARAMPAALNNFLTKRLNVWTQQETRWISMDLWDENKGDVPAKEFEQRLRGAVCYGGLDLGSVNDLAAWVMVFPGGGEELSVIARFWCPEERLYDTTNRYRAQYQAWAREGWLQTTSGRAIDYSFIKAQILRDAESYQLVDLNIDRLFQAHQLAGELMEEGLTVVGMGQGFLSMAAPMKELERRLLHGKIRHGGNPVLRWMAGNVAVKQDPAGNLKPDKATSQGKIDGIVALVMALDRAMRHEKPQRSVYEGRGVLAF